MVANKVLVDRPRPTGKRLAKQTREDHRPGHWPLHCTVWTLMRTVTHRTSGAVVPTGKISITSNNAVCKGVRLRRSENQWCVGRSAPSVPILTKQPNIRTVQPVSYKSENKNEPVPAVVAFVDGYSVTAGPWPHAHA